MAKNIAAWKARVRAAWPGVALRRLDTPKERIQFGDAMPIEVGVKLNGLTPADVCVELLLTRALRESTPLSHSHELTPAEGGDGGEQRYRLDLRPGLAGRLDYRIRVYPRHEQLTHPFEMGLSTWL